MAREIVSPRSSSPQLQNLEMVHQNEFSIGLFLTFRPGKWLCNAHLR
jgi:hypothetical protein